MTVAAWIARIDRLVWGPGMLALLMGTGVFLTQMCIRDRRWPTGGPTSGVGPTGGAAPHPGPTGGAGGGCGPNEGGAETGWEKERAAFFSAQDQTSQTTLAVHLLEPPAAGADGPGVDWGRAVGGLVQFGKTLEHDAHADPVRDATTTHHHGDKKALRKEREKKIAMGHKADDHEEEQKWEQSM